MSLHSLPLFVRLAGRPVILLGTGDAADAKRRLLDRAGAVIGDEGADAVLAIVAIEDEAEAAAAVARLRERGVLVNAVDRPDWCDFTLPAIIDRDPVLIAIGTGGASAGLAAALRRRLEALLPAALGGLADALFRHRSNIRERFPDPAARRDAIAAALAEGGRLDPFMGSGDVEAWLAEPGGAGVDQLVPFYLMDADPDNMTVRQARLLSLADQVYHHANVPRALLDRARADAPRLAGGMPKDAMPGLSVYLEIVATGSPPGDEGKG